MKKHISQLYCNTFYQPRRSPTDHGALLTQRAWMPRGIETRTFCHSSFLSLFRCEGRNLRPRTEMKQHWPQAGPPGLQTLRTWAARTTNPQSLSAEDAPLGTPCQITQSRSVQFTKASWYLYAKERNMFQSVTSSLSTDLPDTYTPYILTHTHTHTESPLIYLSAYFFLSHF